MSWLLIVVAIILFVLAGLKIGEPRRVSFLAWGLAFLATWFAVAGATLPLD